MRLQAEIAYLYLVERNDITGEVDAVCAIPLGKRPGSYYIIKGSREKNTQWRKSGYRIGKLQHETGILGFNKEQGNTIHMTARVVILI